MNTLAQAWDQYATGTHPGQPGQPQPSAEAAFYLGALEALHNIMLAAPHHEPAGMKFAMITMHGEIGRKLGFDRGPGFEPSKS